MADLAASDITVTIDRNTDIEGTVQGRVGSHWAFANLAFGDASLTYPTNGIPMPPPEKFMMNFLVPYKWVEVPPVAGSAILWTYDKTARTGAPYGTLRGTNTTTGSEISGAVAATSLNVKVLGK